MSVLQNFSLRNHHTFGMDVKARFYVGIQTVDELHHFFATKEDNVPCLVLGGGSNILFTKDYEGYVLHIQTTGLETWEDADNYYVKAAAGENWDQLVAFCVSQGFGGLENLSLIPGSVGAAPIQNIGAYGIELKDVMLCLNALNINEKEIENFSNEACAFGYRSSIFKTDLKNSHVIIDVTFCLPKMHKPILGYGGIVKALEQKGITNPLMADVREIVCDIRNSKLPAPELLANAGSFFKNPVVDNATYKKLSDKYPDLVAFAVADSSFKLAAGWLIEKCGLKGYRKGDAGVHEHQALVLVNYGNASGRDVYELAEFVRLSVLSHFGVALDFEVNIF